MGDCILPARIPDKLLDDYGCAAAGDPAPLRRRVVAVTQAGKPRTPLLKEFLSRVEQLAGELRGGAPA